MRINGDFSLVASAAPPRRGALGGVIFGSRTGLAETEFGATLMAPMTLRGSPAIESWRIDAPEDAEVETIRETDLLARRCGGAAMIVGQIPCAPDAIAAATERAYLRLFTLLARMGPLHPVRIWNFVPRINAPDPSGLERYRAFCLGRARAFDQTGTARVVTCAATGIGCLDGPIAFAALAGEAGLRIENPQQIPADAYPARYGPKPPVFARATWGAGRLWISGTAAILGHESAHEADFRRQLALTLDNVTALVSNANLARFGAPPRDLRLPAMKGVKLYVRRAEDIPVAREMLTRALGRSGGAEVFNVDICREELLTEIEGWF